MEQRYHSLDAARAAALLLGVAMHASLSFHMPPPEWVGNDVSKSDTLFFLTFFTHMFRMPAFFLLAGFFAHLVFHRRGLRAFARDRFKRIVIPFVVGFFVIGVLLRIPFVWGLRKENMLPPDLPDLPAWQLAIGIYFTPAAYVGQDAAVAHLWFLYYLTMIYVIWLMGRKLALRILPDLPARIDTIIRTLHTHPSGLLWLSVPQALAVWMNKSNFTGIRTPANDFTPDAGPLLVYTFFFGFGWMLRRQPHLLEVWRRRWALHGVPGLLMALALFLQVMRHHPGGLLAAQAGPSTIGWAGVLYAYALALGGMLLVSAFIGFFERFTASYSPVIRYLADSAYWTYLMHIPIVIALQVTVGRWPLHWTIKFTGITALSTALCLLSYHLLVRNTFLGAVLNGKRTAGPPPARLQSMGAQSVPLDA